MTKPIVNRQAENEQGADSAPETTAKRKNVSKRGFAGPNGTEAEKIEEAVGATYTLLSPNGNKTFTELFSNEKFKTMCAIFGFHTKVGNVANTVLNDKDEPGSPDDAAAAITAWIEQAQGDDPQWAERSGGVAGSRIDKDALAGAIVAYATAQGKGGEAKYQYDVVRQKLEEDPVYVRTARQIPGVQTEYAARVGKPAKSLDDL